MIFSHAIIITHFENTVYGRKNIWTHKVLPRRNSKETDLRTCPSHGRKNIWTEPKPVGSVPK